MPKWPRVFLPVMPSWLKGLVPAHMNGRQVLIFLVSSFCFCVVRGVSLCEGSKFTLSNGEIMRDDDIIHQGETPKGNYLVTSEFPRIGTNSVFADYIKDGGYSRGGENGSGVRL